MSTASGAPRPRPIREAIGHYFLPFYPAALLIGAGWRLAYPDDTWLGIAIDWALLLLVLFAMICSMLWHRLCWRCGTNIPTNPAADAEKHDRHLRFVHRWWMNPRRLIPLLVFCCIVSPFVRIPIGLAYDPIVQRLWDLFTFAIPMAYAFWASYRHQRLQPWCPYCRRRDWGDETTPITPNPNPATR